MDRISPEKRSWNMSRIHSNDTSPELVVRSFLFRHGFRFRLHTKKLPGHPDIVLPKYKTVIEVRGCVERGAAHESGAQRGGGSGQKDFFQHLFSPDFLLLLNFMPRRDFFLYLLYPANTEKSRET